MATPKKLLKHSRSKLKPSKLDAQKELISDDIDLTQIAFITRNLPVMRFEEAVVDGEVSRTIEGASTVTLSVTDNDNLISKSGRIASKVDIKIDGLWFRLVKAKKTGTVLNLTFESREVAILRLYDKKRTTGWNKMSRARFVEILVNEPKELDIPFRTSNQKRLKAQRDKAEKLKNRETGFGWRNHPGGLGTVAKGITIKGKEATVEQMRNIEEVLDTGAAKLVRRKLLVCSIMTVIQESNAYNLVGGHLDSVGMFQQRGSQGWPASRIIPIDAEAFFNKAVKIDADNPNIPKWELCQRVQLSGYPRAYQQWEGEAERIVTNYGIAGHDDSTTSDIAKANGMLDWEQLAGVDEFQFMRGRPKTLPGGKKGWEKETTWDCIVRLAEEVQWRCFEVSGTIYFMSEPWLFMSAPRMRIDEFSPGIDWIDYDLDIGKRSSTVTIKCRISQWEAPPGSTIEIVNMGVINGKWLITDINRKLFSTDATITAKKPRATLPEPKREDIGGLFDNSLSNPDVYVPTPGFQPDLPNGMPTGKALRQAVLDNPRISFSNPQSQQSDIKFGMVKKDVLLFMMLFTEAGFPITVTSLKSDHSTMTASGNVSLHSQGLAIDMGNYGLANPQTQTAMIWIKSHQVQLKFSELIGPVDSLCVPLGDYDAATLRGHDDHIHVGF